MANPAKSALIINADDLGYSPGVNQAIADLYPHGIITSASLIVNLPYSEAGAAIARRLPGLSVGVHLNLSKGEPLLPAGSVPSLVDETGHFWETATLYRRALTGQLNWYEAAAEMEEQVKWARSRGLVLDNLDTHVHFHVLPAARRIIRDLGQRYGVQAWRSPKVLSTLSPHFTWTDLLAKWSGEDPMLAPHFLLSLHQWGDRLLDDQRLQAVLSKPGTVTELVVHPGYAPDPDLPLPDQLLPEHRQAEVDFITGPAFRRWLEELGVVLIGFGDLVYVHG